MSSVNENIPEGWVETTLGDVSTRKQYGYTESASTEEIGPRFLRITDIQNDFINWKSVPFCPISDSDLENFWYSVLKTFSALKLLALGAEISPTLPLLAISTTNLSVIKAMYNRGADFNFITANGENAITRAASLNKHDILIFLINKGVNVKPLAYGYDPLDHILSELVTTTTSENGLLELVKIADLLIYSGAPIEISHKEYLSSLKN